jgi:carboxymethylenebutenolidase
MSEPHAVRGDWQPLQASDGHALQAWCVRPAGEPRGTVVVLQEIFGVNSHIRAVADRFAAEGYVALAPTLFDRVAPQFETGYTPAEMSRAKAVMAKVSFDRAVLDVAAAAQAPLGPGKVAVVGFCWGGTLAWLAATRLPGLACAVSYYGRLVVDFLHEHPRCPVLLHFGEEDKSIPLANVKKIQSAHPEQTYHLYPAGHGFNCDQRADFHKASAELAMERTLAFLREHLD